MEIYFQTHLLLFLRDQSHSTLRLQLRQVILWTVQWHTNENKGLFNCHVHIWKEIIAFLGHTMYLIFFSEVLSNIAKRNMYPDQNYWYDHATCFQYRASVVDKMSLQWFQSWKILYYSRRGTKRKKETIQPTDRPTVRPTDRPDWQQTFIPKWCYLLQLQYQRPLTS